MHFFLTGFLPKDTAKHHREHAVDVLKKALEEANITPDEIDAIAYTKGQLFFCFGLSLP